MSCRGFSIMEMLIVIAVFSVFGLALAVFMTASVKNYRITQERTLLEAETDSLLSTIRRDLESSAPRSEATRPSAFICAYSGSEQSCYFSTLSPESLGEPWAPVLEPGERIPGFPVVSYGIDVRGNGPTLNTTLLRGVGYTAESAAVARTPFSNRCLFMELRFALTEMTTWDSSEAPPSGPSFLWDSTRSLTSAFLGSSSFPESWREFFLYTPYQPVNTDETVFPKRVMVLLGLVADGDPFATLTANASSNDAELFLSTTNGLPSALGPESADINQLLLVGNEWVVYDEARPKSVTILKRGARFSVPVAHYSGTPVYFPRVYFSEVIIPGGRMPK